MASESDNPNRSKLAIKFVIFVVAAYSSSLQSASVLVMSVFMKTILRCQERLIDYHICKLTIYGIPNGMGLYSKICKGLFFFKVSSTLSAVKACSMGPCIFDYLCIGLPINYADTYLTERFQVIIMASS